MAYMNTDIGWLLSRFTANYADQSVGCIISTGLTNKYMLCHLRNLALLRFKYRSPWSDAARNAHEHLQQTFLSLHV